MLYLKEGIGRELRVDPTWPEHVEQSLGLGDASVPLCYWEVLVGARHPCNEMVLRRFNHSFRNIGAMIIGSNFLGIDVILFKSI